MREMIRKNRLMVGLAGMMLIGSVGSILAATVTLPVAKTAGGSDETAACAAGSEVSYTVRTTVSGATVVDSVQIEGIPTGCSGKLIALQFYDASGTLLDEIVWTLAAQSGDTSITAVADETTTSSSNASSSGVSLSYPASQTDPEGLAAAIVASDITRVELIGLASSRAAQE
jgi:hypothetical protein